MRHSACFLLAALAVSACDPIIRNFQVFPVSRSCPGPVTVTWSGDADGGDLVADHPVTPPLPSPAPKQGTATETITQTTTFSFSYPGAGHREQQVTCKLPPP